MRGAPAGSSSPVLHTNVARATTEVGSPSLNTSGVTFVCRTGARARCRSNDTRPDGPRRASGLSDKVDLDRPRPRPLRRVLSTAPGTTDHVVGTGAGDPRSTAGRKTGLGVKPRMRGRAPPARTRQLTWQAVGGALHARLRSSRFRHPLRAGLGVGACRARH